MAYPELVSGGFPSHTFKWLVKVGANKGVIRLDLNKIMAGGGFRATRKPPWIRHCDCKHVHQVIFNKNCYVMKFKQEMKDSWRN